MNAFVWQRFSTKDTFISALGFEIMAFGILEFHENVHSRIVGFGLLSSGKDIFGKLGFGKSSDKDKFRVIKSIIVI
jgi:hypothetical protein